MNAQNKKQMIILGVLLGLAAIVVIYQFVVKGTAPTPTVSSADKSKAPAGAAGAKAPAGKTAAAHGAAPKAAAGKPGEAAEAPKAKPNLDEMLASIKEVDFDYDRDRLPRDPMAPLVGGVSKMKISEDVGNGVVPASTLGQVMSKVVSGIMYDSRRPLAVIDNEVVQPGYEYPDGTKVEKIEKDRVIFRVGDSLIPVELKEL